MPAASVSTVVPSVELAAVLTTAPEAEDAAVVLAAAEVELAVGFSDDAPAL
jgi:hypothetical protein